MDMDKAVSVWIGMRLCQYGYGYGCVSMDRDEADG